ncbi:MAG: ankyrin repeat domain-containing protein [Thermofilum sp.]|nr:ankyrin repeat domain-containing protein [Thermofilum sp.]
MSLDEELRIELFIAMVDGDTARVRKLLRKGANVNAKYGDSDLTPLHWAAFLGHVDVVRLLLEHGAEVNARNKYGETPLHRAAAYGRADAARLLLEHGADVNARDEYGWTPLHVAALQGRADVARLLLEHGADVNVRTTGAIVFVEDFTKSTYSGVTPLHLAAYGGHAEIARLLLERGADPSIRDKDGRTPLDVARERGYEEVVRVIEEYMRGVGVEAPAAPVGTPAQQPAPAAPSIVSVECPGLRAGEWGRLLVRVQGSGTASLSLEGDVDWLDPGRVKLSGESLVEVPVRPKAAGEVPVRVVVRSPGGEDAKITWLKVVDRAGRCPSCGAPVEPGAKYCWRCGAKLK